MKRHTWMQWLVINGAVALSLQAFVASAARADDDEVGRRLGKFGKLSGPEQRKVINAVSSRMKRAADMTNDSDPLRMAVSQALYGTPVAGDAMKGAKIRLRLYAGLNDWALENLFAPRPGAVASCQQQFGLRKGECEALLAAGGQVSLSDASRLGAGQPMNAAPAAYSQPAAGFAQQGAPAGGSRFGRYDSGYRAQPAFAAQQPRPMAQPAWGAQPRPMAQPAWGAQPRPMAQPMQQPMRPVAVQPMAPPPPTAQTVAARKAEYERKRQEYLERKKAEMEARKNKVVAVAVGERVQRGPASAEEAEIAGVEPAAAPSPQPAPVASKTAGKTPAAKGAPEEVAAAPAEAPKPTNEKPALDNSFLDGLMDDPLGKSK